MSIFTPQTTSYTFQPDSLVAGLTQLVSWDFTLIQGQNLKRGALLGKITASGKLTLSLAAAGDGSQVPYAILLDDTDATAGDVNCGVYIKGEFDQNKIIYGTGHTAASVRDGLRDAGIFLKPAVVGS
jgi:hypothetical protein